MPPHQTGPLESEQPRSDEEHVPEEETNGCGRSRAAAILPPDACAVCACDCGRYFTHPSGVCPVHAPFACRSLHAAEPAFSHFAPVWPGHTCLAPTWQERIRHLVVSHAMVESVHVLSCFVVPAAEMANHTPHAATAAVSNATLLVFMHPPWPLCSAYFALCPQGRFRVSPWHSLTCAGVHLPSLRLSGFAHAEGFEHMHSPPFPSFCAYLMPGPHGTASDGARFHL